MTIFLSIWYPSTITISHHSRNNNPLSRQYCSPSSPSSTFTRQRHTPAWTVPNSLLLPTPISASRVDVHILECVAMNFSGAVRYEQFGAPPKYGSEFGSKQAAGCWWDVWNETRNEIHKTAPKPAERFLSVSQCEESIIFVLLCVLTCFRSRSTHPHRLPIFRIGCRLFSVGVSIRRDHREYNYVFSVCRIGIRINIPRAFFSAKNPVSCHVTWRREFFEILIRLGIIYGLINLSFSVACL